MRFYHISAPKNRTSILASGLITFAGERAKRFNQHQHRIYVVDKIWKLNKLMQCSMWKTHPDFKEGFDIYEIYANPTIFKKDEKFKYGLYCETPLKDIRLATTISLSETI